MTKQLFSFFHKLNIINSIVKMLLKKKLHLKAHFFLFSLGLNSRVWHYFELPVNWTCMNW